MADLLFGDDVSNSSKIGIAERDSLRQFRDDLYNEYGIYFPENKFYKLKAKVGKRLRSLNLDTIEEYDKYLQENPSEVSDLLDVISTNTTRFYREERHWEFLETKLIRKWQNQSKVACWSAACSSGEEPYTLATLLEEARREGKFEYNILATDLSENVLQSAVRGVYSTNALRPLRAAHPELVDQCFQSMGRGQKRVGKQLRDRVVFRKFNLSSDNYPYCNTFDLVLIRNVLIYFDDKVVKHVIDNLAASLKKGGYLFTGHSETLNKIDHRLKKVRPSIFQK